MYPLISSGCFRLIIFLVDSLRFFNVYGPRARTSGTYGAVFGVFLAQKFSGNPLTVVGDGKQTRDFIHVDDLVNAFIKVIKSKLVNKIYNLGSGEKTSIGKIAKIFGGKKKFIPFRPGEPKNSLANISKIKKENVSVTNIDISVENEYYDKTIELGSIKTNMNGECKFVIKELKNV